MHHVFPYARHYVGLSTSDPVITAASLAVDQLLDYSIQVCIFFFITCSLDSLDPKGLKHVDRLID